MHVLSWRTVSALTRVLFCCLFPSLLHNLINKHQNNPLVSAETVRHSSTYIIKLAHQNARSRSECPISDKWNVQFITFWSKWCTKKVGSSFWSSIAIVYKRIYGQNRGHGTRRHLEYLHAKGQQDSGQDAFLIVCTANAKSCCRHILLDFATKFAAINHCKVHSISISFIGYLKQLCWKP